jgi:hypothetical protein
VFLQHKEDVVDGGRRRPRRVCSNVQQSHCRREACSSSNRGGAGWRPGRVRLATAAHLSMAGVGTVVPAAHMLRTPLPIPAGRKQGGPHLTQQIAEALAGSPQIPPITTITTVHTTTR